MNAASLSVADLLALGQQALLLAVIVSLPVLMVAALAGLISAVFQAATQLQDPAIGHLPKFLGVVLTLIAAAPWMGRQVLGFALHALGSP